VASGLSSSPQNIRTFGYVDDGSEVLNIISASFVSLLGDNCFIYCWPEGAEHNVTFGAQKVILESFFVSREEALIIKFTALSY
jgi:hypothetical protein